MTDGVCQYNPKGGFTRTTGGILKPGDVQKAAGRTSMPSTGGARHSYTQALHYVQIFYESMRSGRLDRQRLAWCRRRPPPPPPPHPRTLECAVPLPCCDAGSSCSILSRARGMPMACIVVEAGEISHSLLHGSLRFDSRCH